MKLKLTLKRVHRTLSGVAGLLIAPDESVIATTLEPPWLRNRKNESCIPAGLYKVKYLDTSASGKYKEVYHIRGVENRTGILIHKGNYVADTTGCILIGMGFKDETITHSADGLRRLHSYTNRQSFFLRIQDEVQHARANY